MKKHTHTHRNQNRHLYQPDRCRKPRPESTTYFYCSANSPLNLYSEGTCNTKQRGNRSSS